MKIALHWKILIGVILGLIWGIVSVEYDYSVFTSNWIKPFGTIFMNMLKLVAVPLVMVSLIDGIGSLGNVSGLSRMGGKTIGIYILTTMLAISIGLVMVNLIRPGDFVSAEKKTELQEKYSSDAKDKIETAAKEKEKGPLNMLENIVPDNIVRSMSDNKLMLQVIFFALLFGIAVISLPADKTKPVRDFIRSFNEVMLKLVELIMAFAPYGVFALLASMNADLAMLSALGVYCLAVLLGLGLMVTVVYPLMLKLFSNQPIVPFFRKILPAQLLAFSTSSSAAALPVNMKICEEELGMKEETTGFVLPLGATINMDGTSLYQAVAAIFIAQTYGMELGLTEQLGIVLTATLASIGAAPVPGAGMVMLVIILQSAGLNAEGLALIIGVDRILDMFRTTVNITSDATVAAIIDHQERKREEGIHQA
ncbi:MAG TPA: dicarboxylate/amino acid:cation symporter [Flavobacteriales bacterium]|nr:dicarboxylate/amino acid:cation symporter [Flavobacteriales bacterium]HCA82874.1 dicarboxylate/amino acid:cation symporter [Flavobacteriales bacterium]HRE75389.1 dicarboxylate/amino acid:cation symporter [Flavobacteriales bacterium]HRE96080.1 dicarboxylate/amino acid:cation symporter [Flavobacteriales bacterium]HRJ36376.1 dicarboxylate/amino acid:cation symporter [Flavobacteriales bacterium]